MRTNPSRAQQAQATTRFQKGLQLFKDGDYQAALIEFRRAQELAPTVELHYRLAQTYYELGHYEAALQAFEQYLAEGGHRIAATRRFDVERDIEKLRSRLSNPT